MKNRYWKKMMHFKYEIIYLSLYFAKCVSVLRWTKIFLAFCSSAAIAAWANYADLAILWGAIIVVSQVVGAVIELLPIQKRISELSSVVNQLSLLYVEVESNWNDVYSGNYTDKEINNILYKFEHRKTSIDNKYFSDDAFKENKKLKEKAEKEMDQYAAVIFMEDNHA